MANVPLSFFPLRASKVISWPFKGIGEIFQKSFPHYENVLKQTDLSVTKDEFFAIALMNAFIWWILLSGIMAIILNILSLQGAIKMAPIVGFVLAILVFFRIVVGIQLSIGKKAKSIDSNLIFGLKMMLVEIDSGVGLFDSMVMIASYKLGDLSKVFKEIAKRLNSGENEAEVLTDVAAKNQSPFLKKVLWQIVSGLKVGSPLGKVIEESLESLERQQKTDIIEYGSSLRVLTLIFMMMGVIIPAMGVAFLVVLNSLPGLSIGIEILWLFVIGVAFFEFMLIGFIKSKRPNLMGSV
ncbi:MAG: type II secretion system F family protein [archaeon]